jgi:hypothetical protein
MSSLGIRFALPYKGGNGLIVTNNIVGLDPNGYGSIGCLDIALNAETPTAIANTTGYSLRVNSSNDNGNTSTLFRDTTSNDNIVEIGRTGVIDNTTNGATIYTSGLQADNNVTGLEIAIGKSVRVGTGTDNTKGLQFNTPNGANNVIIETLVTAGVTPSITRYIPIVIGGTTYKLIIAN